MFSLSQNFWGNLIDNFLGPQCSVVSMFDCIPKTNKRAQMLHFLIIWFYSYSCPVEHQPETVFIGRTEYKIVMSDTKRANRLWKATFVDYSSHLLPGNS